MDFTITALLAQTAQPIAEQPLPVTPQGALVLILMGLVPLAPRLWGALVKGIETLVTRMGTRTDAQVQSTLAFTTLKEEVEHLRQDRKIDRLRITETEQKAREAIIANERFSEELRSMRIELATLRQERDTARGQLVEKDKQIEELELRNEKLVLTVYTLTMDGRKLRKLLSENNIPLPEETI